MTPEELAARDAEHSLLWEQAANDPEFTDTTSDGPTFEFHPCSCPACECPNITDNGGECLACSTGHHEAEE